jgi:hypothetical protein
VPHTLDAWPTARVCRCAGNADFTRGSGASRYYVLATVAVDSCRTAHGAPGVSPTGFLDQQEGSTGRPLRGGGSGLPLPGGSRPRSSRPVPLRECVGARATSALRIRSSRCPRTHRTRAGCQLRKFDRARDLFEVSHVGGPHSCLRPRSAFGPLLGHALDACLSSTASEKAGASKSFVKRARQDSNLRPSVP